MRIKYKIKGDEQIMEAVIPDKLCGSDIVIKIDGVAVFESYGNNIEEIRIQDESGVKTSACYQDPKTFDREGFEALKYTPIDEVTDLGGGKR
jgi:hypothetical protein